jgi:hypothetical protein
MALSSWILTVHHRISVPWRDFLLADFGLIWYLLVDMNHQEEQAQSGHCAYDSQYAHSCHCGVKIKPLELAATSARLKGNVGARLFFYVTTNVEGLTMLRRK